MKYIVAGNYTRFAVTLTQKSGELIVPYIPTEGDVVQISLYGARRFDYPNYEQAQNVLTFEDNGCLSVGLYCLEVKITEANTHKLRCMYREQIRVVASNDDVPTDASFETDDVQLTGQFDIAASVEIDDALSTTSENPVQNKIITAALNVEAIARAAADRLMQKNFSEYKLNAIPIRNLGLYDDMTTMDDAIINSVEPIGIAVVSASLSDYTYGMLCVNIPYYNGTEYTYTQWCFRTLQGKRTLFSRVIYYDSAARRYRTRGKKDIQNENI